VLSVDEMGEKFESQHGKSNNTAGLISCQVKQKKVAQFSEERN